MVPERVYAMRCGAQPRISSLVTGWRRVFPNVNLLGAPKAARGSRPYHHWTLKIVILAAVPPGVVTLIFPVFARFGTVAVMSVSLFTVNVVAFTPPNVTLVACVKLSPSMLTTVPTGPFAGEKLRISGRTRNSTLLVKMPAGTTTRSGPVVAPTGTVAVISVFVIRRIA
jgi:hypothetical protein